MKKKINSVSKNLEQAKKDLEENKIKKEQKNLTVKLGEERKKSPFKRNKSSSSFDINYEKERNFNKNKRINLNLSHKKSHSKNKTILRDTGNTFHENTNWEEEDSEILKFNRTTNIKIISTKVEKTNENTQINHKLMKHGLNLNLINQVDNFEEREKDYFSDEVLQEKIKQLEQNLFGNNKTNDENKSNKASHQKENEHEKSFESAPEESLYNMNKDLTNKFDNLLGLEESMKKLNQILDYSNKSSLRFKLENQKLSPRIEEEEPLPYKIENTFSNFHSKENIITPKKKTIDLNKSKKVFNIDEKVLLNPPQPEEEEDLDYLKNLLLKTKSDLDNLNKKIVNK